MLTIEMIKLALLLGIASFVYSIVLTDANMILNKLYLFLQSMNEKKILPTWIFKPLIDCMYCVGGQVGLWVYLCFYWNDYDLFQHIIFILLTIFSVQIAYLIWNFKNILWQQQN